MKVLVVSGIWPPDVGGPASHAPEVAGFLHERGHRVEVLVVWNDVDEPSDVDPGIADLIGLLEEGDLERHPQGEYEKRDPIA